MWHLHWQADAARRPRTVEPPRPRAAGDLRSGRASFPLVWRDTPAGTLAGDVPESVRVRGR
ncbi:hypothetical protein ACR9E3_18540 [Actinomycetospora sp. C-140]